MTNILNTVPLDYFDTNRLNQLKQRWIESPSYSATITWGNESYIMDSFSLNHEWGAIDLITATFEEKVEKMDGVTIYHFINASMIGFYHVKSPFS